MRRKIIKGILATPVACLLFPRDAFACAMGFEGLVVPNSESEPIYQGSFELFSARFRNKYPYPDFHVSEKVSIAVPREPDGGEVISAQIKVDINKLKAELDVENLFCKQLRIYGESEGQTLEQLPPHTWQQAGVLWTHYISSYQFSNDIIPEITERVRHVGLLMSICVAAEIEYLYKGRQQNFFLFGSSQKIKRPPCYFGYLSQKSAP